MELEEHLQVTGGALWSWFRAQTYDSLAAGVLWLVGLRLLHVPWALGWAILAVVLHYIPHLGPVLALIGPAVTAGVSGGWEQLLRVLILYAIVVLVEGFLLQPLFMKHTARVPIWASLFAPIVLGLVLSFWGVLLAAPLLAVVYAYRARMRTN